MLYRNNRPNRDMCKRFFDDNLKTYALRALKVSWVPTYSTIEVTFEPIMTYLRPSEAEILFWDNHPNREMHKRFFDDNSKTYVFRALKVSWVPTNSTIAVTFNPIITLIASCINGFLTITRTNNTIATWKWLAYPLTR